MNVVGKQKVYHS